MPGEPTIPTETVIPIETVPLKFGLGATEELGYELDRLGIHRALLVADENLRGSGLFQKVETIVRDAGIELDLYTNIHVEPTDTSMKEAIEFARKARPEAFISLGGGSTIDTAKVMDLFSTHTGELMDYINRPIGAGKAVPGPLKPHIALPTTGGTGSETTPVAILDLLDLKVKTGISHRFVRPTLAIVDPLNTVSCPLMVTAAAGCDVLCHAAESYTARRYDTKPRVQNPAERPAYIGSNPVSDLWSEQALTWCGQYLRRAVYDPLDIEARTYMSLASSFAGIGFGTAGVHIPHAMAYPVAGMVRDYHPPDYHVAEAMVPHGMSVIVNAPAAFRYTAPAWPQRHMRAAELLGESIAGVPEGAAGEMLAQGIIRLMQDIGIPNGLQAIGYDEKAIPGLVQGALKQHRLLTIAPRPVDEDVMTRLFESAMRYW